jgi:alpha-ketoglutaric semialdehyde dehydrogenase
VTVTTRTLHNFIAGEWTAASGAAAVADVNPANPQDVIAEVPLSTRKDAEEAIAAASEAFQSWSATPSLKRGQILVKASRLLEQQEQRIAHLVTREQGKTLAEARAEVSRAAHFWGWMGYQAGSIQGVTAPTEYEKVMALTLREPLGVVSLITPWNFPVNVPAYKLASALVCGNTVVLKPALLTPLCAVALVEVLAEAGVPHGVVNLVLGSGAELGDVLVTDAHVKAISFTGSTQTGLSINARGAALGKRVQAEMGGHNAVVVLEDADLKRAATGVAMAAFGVTGQRCTAPRRIIAVAKIASELIGHLQLATRALRVGPGNDEHSDVGPMVDEKSLLDVLGEIDRARTEGAHILEGGARVADTTGYFLQPTLLTGVNRKMAISQEEVFGPVLPVLEVDSIDEAIETAVSTKYGLSSSIYTRDFANALRFVHETDAGLVHVNKPPTGVEVHLPFGGLKDSGVGPKELGSAVDAFTQVKTVYLDYS